MGAQSLHWGLHPPQVWLAKITVDAAGKDRFLRDHSLHAAAAPVLPATKATTQPTAAAATASRKHAVSGGAAFAAGAQAAAAAADENAKISAQVAQLQAALLAHGVQQMDAARVQDSNKRARHN